MTNPFAQLDAALALALNHWAEHATAAGPILAWLASADLVKTTPFILMLIIAWHRQPFARSRPVVVQGLLGAGLAMALGRLLPAVLPFRFRPLNDPALGLHPVPGVSAGALDSWTAFPSDHGMLFGALVGAAFALDRRLGWAATAFVASLVLLPRMVLGYHYASDILAGVLLGLGCAWLAQRPWVARYAGQPLLAQERRHPAVFHAVAFVLLSQLAVLFGPLRTALGLAWKALH
jgi:membrane-associated phospholipid phosphatase